MRPIFDPEELTLVTDKEKTFQDKYIDMLIKYADGKADGVQVKNLNTAMSNVSRMVQSRSAMALLKFNVLRAQDKALADKLLTKQASLK